MAKENNDQNLQPAAPTVYRQVGGRGGFGDGDRAIVEKVEEATITPAQRAYEWALDLFSIKPGVFPNVLDILQVNALTVVSFGVSYYLWTMGMTVLSVMLGLFTLLVYFGIGGWVALNSPLGMGVFWVRFAGLIAMLTLFF